MQSDLEPLIPATHVHKSSVRSHSRGSRSPCSALHAREQRRRGAQGETVQLCGKSAPKPTQGRLAGNSNAHSGGKFKCSLQNPIFKVISKSFRNRSWANRSSPSSRSMFSLAQSRSIPFLSVLSFCALLERNRGHQGAYDPFSPRYENRKELGYHHCHCSPSRSDSDVA